MTRNDLMALYGFALGIVIAILMKKGFWGGVAFAIVGSLLMRGLVTMMFPTREKVTFVIKTTENED